MSVYSSTIIAKKSFSRISFNFSRRTCWAIKSNSSFWISLWAYFNLVFSNTEWIEGSFVSSSLSSYVKLLSPGFPWMAIPCHAENLRHRITMIKCFLSFRQEYTMLWLVNSITLPHLVTTVSNAAAALWLFVCWWFLKHLGAFFHELKPTLMYACSLFSSLSKSLLCFMH